jgi:hypothetical protein
MSADKKNAINMYVRRQNGAFNTRDTSLLQPICINVVSSHVELGIHNLMIGFLTWRRNLPHTKK